MKTFLLATFGLLMILSACKNVPSFTVDNELDPYHPNFKIENVDSYMISIYNREKVELRWDFGSAKFIDGIEIHRSIGDTSNFLKIFEADLRINSTMDTLPANTINFYYKILSFYYVDDNVRKISPPLYESIEQAITFFEVVHVGNDTLELRWDSDFKLNASLNIYRSHNENPYTFLDSVSVYENYYMDEFDDESDSLSYKISIKNAFEELVETSPEITSEYLSVPYISSVSQISDSEIELNWDNWQSITKIEFWLRPLNSASNKWELIASAEPADKKATISDLDINTAYELKIDVKRGSIYSSYPKIYILKYQNSAWNLEDQ